MAKRSIDQLLCLWGAPAPVYKGARGEAAGLGGGCTKGGVLLPPGVGLPPFLVQVGEGKEGEDKEKEGEGGKGGKRARPPSPIRFGLGGSRALPPLFHHLAHEAQYFFPRIPVTPRYSEKYPNHLEPNIVIQYIDLYVSTISRLLVISLISSGTPNYLRYIKSHNS